MERLGLSGIIMCCLLWAGCGVIAYGLFVKRDNDFCLMWSRNRQGQIVSDRCAYWQGDGNDDFALFMSLAGPLALPAALMMASEESHPRLEFTLVTRAYPGKRAER